MCADDDQSLPESTDDEPFVIVDDEPESSDEISDEPAEKPEDELDGFRIRQLSQMRRSNVRSQTYAIVGMVVCAVAVVKLALLARDSYAGERWLYLAGYSIVGLAGIIGAILCALQADRLRDELKQPQQTFDQEPDFEPLSDGTQHVTNLHDMVEENPRVKTELRE